MSTYLQSRFEMKMKPMHQKSHTINCESKSQHPMNSVSQDSQKQHQQLLDDIPEGYVEYDLKGNMICFNKAVIEMGGRDEDELRNISYKDFMTPEAAKKASEIYKEVYRTGIAKRGFENEIIHKDGSKIIVEGFVSLIKSNGKAVGFRGIWRDITKRKKTELELADHKSQLETVFGSVKDGIIAVDNKGRVIKANQAVEKICGVSVADIIGKPLVEATAPCCKSCRTIIQDSLSNRFDIKECQIHCRRNDRAQRVIVLNSSPLINANGRRMGAVIVIRNITELLGMETKLKGRYKFQNIIGKSPKMQEIYDLLENLSNLETTVLITGESGTGKELVANALHYAGGRSDKPLVKVNCSALPESLLESELFGHVKGAFTGANKNREGRFKSADGGTILLDEIGDISPLIQLKLLRVLQEKEFERVGESIPCKVNVRIITSTNKSLPEKIKNGEFREDLYYRLKVMEITIPPLRKRLEDLPMLVDHFCNQFRKSFKKNIEGVSGDVMNLLMSYPWPGNVRELEHVLEHCFVFCNGPIIMAGHLPKEIRKDVETQPKRPQNRSKRISWNAKMILNALEKNEWNITKTAELLGVERRTIQRKIKQFNLVKKTRFVALNLIVSDNTFLSISALFICLPYLMHLL